MTDQAPDPRRQNTALIVLGLAVLLLLGTLLGFVLGGLGDDEEPSDSTVPATVSTTIAQLSTTTLPAPVTTSGSAATTTTTAASAGEQFAFPASEDLMVDSDAPDQVLGMVEVLAIEQDDAGDERRALIRFEVSGLPTGAPVTSATLRLTLIEASVQVGLVNLVDGPWTELTTTWNTAPAIGAPVAPLAGTEEGTQVDVDVSSVVVGDGTYDFYLTLSSPDGLEFASREAPAGGPVLLVTVGQSGSASGEGTVLVGAADIASCSSDGDELTAALLDEVVAGAGEAVVFAAGDIAYEDGSAQAFANCYEPSWGRHKAITRPAPGSREYRTPGASAYFEYFGAAAGEPGLGYYSYDLGGWHIISLNSNCTEVACEAGSQQEQWLRQDLAANNALCTAAYWHQPLFSSRSGGTNPEMAPLFQALYDDEAEVVINGNDHFYERFLPQDATAEEDNDGIVQFTVGTGGRSFDEYGGASANSGVRFNQSFGVLALTLDVAGYDWDFVTPPDSPFSDSGSATCH